MKRIFNTYTHYLSSIDKVELALKITLVLFLFSEWVSGQDWRLFTPIIILSGLGLIVPSLHKNKILWYLLSIIFIIKTINNWWIQDNHLFVNTYWVIAIAFALSFKDSQKVLAKNARIMIGLVFLFATVWKFLSPDFSSGAYFHFTFLTDKRFSEEVKIIGGLSGAELNQNTLEINQVISEKQQSAKLITNNTIKNSTKIITYHTILIESLLALLFLIPAKLKISRYRNYVLIVFALTTYLTMPIHSFAWLIIAICISQTRENEIIDRAILFASLPLMLIYKFVPFMSWIANSI